MLLGRESSKQFEAAPLPPGHLETGDSRNSQRPPDGAACAEAPAQTVSRGSPSKFTGLLPPGACEGGLQTDRSPPAPAWPQPGPSRASGPLVLQLAAGVRDPLVLSEVPQSSAEAADLLHMGLRHPPLLTIGQTHTLQPAWEHTAVKSCWAGLGRNTAARCQPGAR